MNLHLMCTTYDSQKIFQSYNIIAIAIQLLKQEGVNTYMEFQEYYKEFYTYMIYFYSRDSQVKRRTRRYFINSKMLFIFTLNRMK